MNLAEDTSISQKDFWYVVAESRELAHNQVLSRTVMGEWLAVFRDENGKVVAMRDRCAHRGAQISKGSCRNGKVTCPYHGWTYDGSGRVTSIPSEGPRGTAGQRHGTPFLALEQDDFIYVCLSESTSFRPFSVPCYGKAGYTTIRLQNRFQNSVINCAENFVDIPHTTYVHPKIFRDPKGEVLRAKVRLENGSVIVEYFNEKKNLGIFSWFLNPSGHEIRHVDEFHMPNVTSVHYWFGPTKHFIITSQSIPMTENETLVYTDLTYNYGIWNWPSRPIVRRQAQMIIDQDIEILNNQGRAIQKYGSKFQNSPADIIHIFIESIQNEIDHGRNPKLLPAREKEIEFWV